MNCIMRLIVNSETDSTPCVFIRHLIGNLISKNGGGI